MIYLIGMVTFTFGIALYARSASILTQAFKEANNEGILLFNGEYKSAIAAFSDLKIISKIWCKEQSILTESKKINLLLLQASQRIRQSSWLAVIGGVIVVIAAFYYVD